MLFEADLIAKAKTAIEMIFSSNPCIGNNASPVAKPKRARTGAPQDAQPDARSTRVPLSKGPPAFFGDPLRPLNLWVSMAMFTPSIPDDMKVSVRESVWKVVGSRKYTPTIADDI